MDISPFLGGRLELDFLAGLIAGLASGAHCLAMCGGVAAAIALRARGGALSAMAVPGAVGRSASVLLQAQLGRIAIYALMGAAAGALGAGLHLMHPSPLVHDLLRWIAAGVLVTAAMAVAGIAPFNSFGARLGSGLMRRLPALHRLGPVGLGAAWGLMPCSMVYLTTFYAGLSGSTAQGALIMIGFGLGTAPAVLAAGLGAGAIAGLARTIWLRAAAALALLALAAASVL